MEISSDRCISFIFFLNFVYFFSITLYIKGTQKNRKYRKRKKEKKTNLKTEREITKESSLHAIYNKNRIYKITKGRVTKFTKAKKKPKYVTAV